MTSATEWTGGPSLADKIVVEGNGDQALRAVKWEKRKGKEGRKKGEVKE